MADVFLSYCNRKDRREIVRRMATALRVYGFSVWWDDGLKGGLKFEPSIFEELKKARAIVPLWCRKSIQSPWVRKEAMEGLNRGILCPAFLQKVPPPDEFKALQADDLVDWDGNLESRDLSKLLETVGRTVGKTPKAPNDLLEDLSKLPPIAPLPSLREVAQAETFRVYSNYEGYEDQPFGNEGHAGIIAKSEGNISLMGFSLYSFHNEDDQPLGSTIRTKLERGDKIRVLIMDPKNVQGLSQTVFDPQAAEDISKLIEKAIPEWRALAADFPRGHVEVRCSGNAVIRHVTTITAKQAVISPYWYAAASSKDRPTLVCDESSVFFELINQEFEALWSNGTPVIPS